MSWTSAERGEARTRRALPQIGVLQFTAVALVALFVMWPFARLLIDGLSSSAVGDIVSNARIRRIAWFTIWQAALSTAAVVTLALPLSAVLSRSRFRGRRAAMLFAAAPFTLPTVVVGTAFLATLPGDLRQGWFAIICAHIFFNVGMATRVLTTATEGLDGSPWEAARTLGASPFVAWRTITFRQLQPYVLAVASIVGTLTLTSFGTVLLLGGPSYATVDVEIYRQALQALRLDRAAALAVLQFAVVGAVLVWTLRHESPPASTRSRNRRAAMPLVAQFAAATVLVGVVLTPLVALARRALRQADGSFGFDNFRALTKVTRGSGLVDTPITSLVVSLRTASAAAVIAIVVGTAVAVAATRSRSLTARRAMHALGTLPLATSAVALGLGVLLGFSSEPFAWRRSAFLLPCVQAVVCLPFVVRTILPALTDVPPALSDAAETLGASPWWAWWSIDFAVARRSIGVAIGLAFTVALGEFGASSFLARPQTPTMPIAIARLSGRPGQVVQGQAAALALVLGVLTMLCVGLAERTRRPR